jgi:hypothetical protein
MDEADEVLDAVAGLVDGLFGLVTWVVGWFVWEHTNAIHTTKYA